VVDAAIAALSKLRQEEAAEAAAAAAGGLGGAPGMPSYGPGVTITSRKQQMAAKAERKDRRKGGAGGGGAEGAGGWLCVCFLLKHTPIIECCVGPLLQTCSLHPQTCSCLMFHGGRRLGACCCGQFRSPFPLQPRLNHVSMLLPLPSPPLLSPCVCLQRVSWSCSKQ
jgi:hypothetical protein